MSSKHRLDAQAGRPSTFKQIAPTSSQEQFYERVERSGGGLLMQQVECLERGEKSGGGLHQDQKFAGRSRLRIGNTFHRHRAFRALLVGGLVKQTRGLSILDAGALKFLRAMRCLDRMRFRSLFFGCSFSSRSPLLRMSINARPFRLVWRCYKEWHCETKVTKLRQALKSTNISESI